jgi:hypothetical protein
MESRLSQFEKAREEYRPYEIRVLLIAESPPSSGGFFYFPRTTGKDHLFRETMKALGLWPLNKPLPRGIDKRPMLKQFQSTGLYLIDTSVRPVDKLPLKERRDVVVSQLPRLARDVAAMRPRGIVIVKSSIFDLVSRELGEFGVGSRILNKGPIPFPSHGNQSKYRSLLRDALDRLVSLGRESESSPDLWE